jgi:hypothetical protein
VNKQQILAVRAVATALLQTVAEAGPLGAPGGHMYAAVMGTLSLSQFETIMGTLVDRGFVRKDGDVYHSIKASLS